MSINKLVQNRFRLVYTSFEGSVDEVITPKYDKSLTLATEREGEEYFYRTKCGYKFILTRENFQLIKDGPFDEDFEIILESNFFDEGWNERWRGVFNYTDCEFDEDRKQVSFTARTNDVYESIMNNWEREYNLFDLDVPTVDVEYKQKGLIQLYTMGSEVVTNYTENGQWSEQKVEPTYDIAKLQTDYFFSQGEIKVWVSGSGLITPDVSGYYELQVTSYVNGDYRLSGIGSTRLFKTNVQVGLDDFDDYPSIWEVDGNQFAFVGIINIGGEYNMYFLNVGSNSAPSTGTLTHVSGGTYTTDIPYTSTQTQSDINNVRSAILNIPGSNYEFIGPTFKGSPGGASSPSGVIMKSLNNNDECTLHIATVVTRILTNESTVGSQPTQALPEDDFVQTNYQFAIPVVSFTGLYWSDENSSSSGFYGKYASDAPNYASQFFVRPSDPDGLIPFNQSEWRFASMWFKPTAIMNGISLLATTTRTVQAIRLSDAIKALLGEFSTVTYEEDTNHSRFFYSGSNPLTGVIPNDVYITPKSNVTKNGYDFAASKANIKFKDLMDSLKIVYNVGWHVDANNRFRIEHALFYWYGGEYGSPKTSFDLTNLVQPRLNKPWSFGTNKYSFDKTKIPSQTKFDWMDLSSDVFEGFPINHNDKYVDKSLIEEKVVTILSSDMDAMTSNPEGFSREGFAILDIDGNNQVHYENITFKGVGMIVQNGRLCFPYLHNEFYKSPTKCSRTNINGVDFISVTIGRSKIQELEFPFRTPVFDAIELMRSNLGYGKVESFTENITTHEVKAKLRHETKK